MSETPGTNEGCSKLFSWGFLFVWCAGVFYIDAMFFWNILRQAQTLGYAETTGTITSSQIQGKKSRYLSVTYTYTVGGQVLKGSRFRTNVVGTNTGAAERHAAAYPVGREVPVYYDPADPTEAILVKGPTGVDLFIIWFLLPFNVVAFGGLLVLLRGKRPAFDPDDPRVVVHTDAGWQFRPRATARIGAFAFGLFLMGLLGVFALGLPTQFDPPLELMLAAWILGPMLVWHLASRFARRVALEWNEREQTLALPWKGLIVPLSEIHGFPVEWDTAFLRQKRNSVPYHVALRYGPNRTTVRFASWSDRDAAHTAANWLSAAIGVPFHQS
jgi:hypothetical protein